MYADNDYGENVSDEERAEQQEQWPVVRGSEPPNASVQMGRWEVLIAQRVADRRWGHLQFIRWITGELLNEATYGISTAVRDYCGNTNKWVTSDDSGDLHHMGVCVYTSDRSLGQSVRRYFDTRYAQLEDTMSDTFDSGLSEAAADELCSQCSPHTRHPIRRRTVLQSEPPPLLAIKLNDCMMDARTKALELNRELIFTAGMVGPLVDHDTATFTYALKAFSVVRGREPFLDRAFVFRMGDEWEMRSHCSSDAEPFSFTRELSVEENLQQWVVSHRPLLVPMAVYERVDQPTMAVTTTTTTTRVSKTVNFSGGTPIATSSTISSSHLFNTPVSTCTRDRYTST